MDDPVYAVFIAGLLVVGVVLGLVTNRLWVALIPVALGVVAFAGADNDEIPGWFLGLIVGAPIGLGALFGVLARRTDWARD